MHTLFPIKTCEQNEVSRLFFLKEWQSYDHNVEYYYTIKILDYGLVSGVYDLRFKAPQTVKAVNGSFSEQHS